VILITGASSGIGAACADRLQRNGWTVVGASRRGTSTGAWQPLTIDVDSDESVTAGVNRVHDTHGRIDAVVTCAGWGLAGPVETTPLDDARAQLETNFWGSVRVVDAVLPTMRRQRGGRIVLVGSIGGRIGIPFQAFYSASKFALEGFGEALAHEVGPHGIEVTVLEPGNVRTDFTAARRRVGSTAADPYEPAASRAIERMERDEREGVTPERVAATIERVLTGSRPPRRASVGRAGERAALVAQRLLPHRLFERAARRGLGL
jgi:NAD(P)-dependent dehydrogenase (short-subunit alcohol dehydrogenase family)